MSDDSFIKHFFSNPVVGIVGSIASILGIILAIYFFLESKSQRELMFFVHPVRTVVLKSNQTSRLALTLDNKPINQDVSAAQIAIWNEGNESIRSINMLKTLTISTFPAPIIEVRIRKITREVINFQIDETKLNNGEVSITWNILEHNDGGVVQIIYLGDTHLPIVANAIIEGQGTINELQYRYEIQSPEEQYPKSYKAPFIMGVMFLVGGILSLTFIIYTIIKGNKNRPVQYYSIIFPLMMILLSLYFIFFMAKVPGPPFGF